MKSSNQVHTAKERKHLGEKASAKNKKNLGAKKKAAA